jgi:hypothetical protein
LQAVQAGEGHGRGATALTWNAFASRSGTRWGELVTLRTNNHMWLVGHQAEHQISWNKMVLVLQKIIGGLWGNYWPHLTTASSCFCCTIYPPQMYPFLHVEYICIYIFSFFTILLLYQTLISLFSQLSFSHSGNSQPYSLGSSPGWHWSYHYPVVAAGIPSQPVVVVGQMAVWVVPHKPRGVGHLLMETNETKHEWEMTQTRGRDKKIYEKESFGANDLHSIVMRKQPSWKNKKQCIVIGLFLS